MSKPESALKSFLSGGVGGVCALAVGHPFDLIKVRIQTASATSSARSASVFSLLAKTLQTEGIRGIYRGVSAPLFATTPMFAVSFWGYDMGKRLVRSASSGDDDDSGNMVLTTSQICVAGAISAFPTVAIMAPSERIKCLLQVQANEIEKGGKAKYAGMTDCAKQLYREGGIWSIYRGTGATLLRDVPGAIAYFGVYEVAKKQLTKLQTNNESSKSSSIVVLTAGGLAGMACWGISIPADVLKSRLQTAPEGTYPGGLADVYRQLMKEEGASALFRGMRPALIRAFPANAACFLGMEVSRDFLSFLD